MKPIKINFSTEVIEAADEIAAKLGVSRSALISFCFEGSTYLYGKKPCQKRKNFTR